MFTGLIESTGRVTSIAGAVDKRITVETELAPRLRIGDSVAVNGVCLTAVEVRDHSFSADLLQETLRRTTFANMSADTIVNIELPMAAGAPMGGHVVQGHVDGVARIVMLEPEISGADASASSWRFGLQLPNELLPYVVLKGSITVDGISLTIAALRDDIVEISLIPHTYAMTNIRRLRIGDHVNIETDALARYAQRLLQRKQQTPITLGKLVEEGY